MHKLISPLRWMGGKAKQWKIIKQYLPAEEPEIFIDLFCGGGSVFLNVLQHWKNTDIYVNDIYQELIDFFRDCQKYRINTTLLRKLAYPNSKTLSDIYKNLVFFSKSEQFFITNCLSYSGANKSTYSKLALKQNFNQNKINRLENMIDLLSDNNRVSFISYDYAYLKDSINKQYENKDYETLCGYPVQRNILVYLDPPYFYNQKKNIYKHSTIDFTEFYNFCNELKAKWILSIDNNPYIKELFKDYNIYEHNWKYSSTNSHNNSVKQGRELIITNFKGGFNE